jgi:hypothetical protein
MYSDLILVDKALAQYHLTPNPLTLRKLDKAFVAWGDEDFDGVEGIDNAPLHELIDGIDEELKKLKDFASSLRIQAKRITLRQRKQAKADYLQGVDRIVQADFKDWRLTNYKKGYAHLLKPKAVPRTASEDVKNKDAMLSMSCQAFRGRRKATTAVNGTGATAFKNGGGCCTTSAFAVAHRLLSGGVTGRIEIIGQTSLNNGHMWVVCGREGGTRLDGNVRRPANPCSDWGGFVAVDAWLMAFGWEGVWRKPREGKHHFFIVSDHKQLEITYDSMVPGGDPPEG